MSSLIAFDFDGTLFDTRRDICAAVNHARESFSLPQLSLEEVTQMVGHGVTVLTQRAFSDTPISPEEAEPVLMEYYASHPADYAELYPGVRSTLAAIQQGKVIVSNKPEALIRAMLEQSGIGHHFRFVAGGDTFPRKKPDPAAIRFLQNRFSVGNREIVMVGDHPADIKMAQNAGIWSIFCKYGFVGIDETGADFEIESFAQLPEVIGKVQESRAD